MGVGDLPRSADGPDQACAVQRGHAGPRQGAARRHARVLLEAARHERQHRRRRGVDERRRAARERAVGLPTAQRLGKAAAIIDNMSSDGDAGGADGAAPREENERTRAEVYAVDLESAYSFVPVQRADWWLQAFVWWRITRTPDGAWRCVVGFCLSLGSCSAARMRRTGSKG